MRTLYLECKMGAAGDMLTAALLELVDDRHLFTEKMNSLFLPGVSISAVSVVKMGITGTQMCVKINGTEEESKDADISDHHHDNEHGHDHDHDHHHHHENGHHHEHQHAHHHDHGHHSHTTLHDIGHIVSELNVSEKVKNDILSVYRIIAEAESSVHGRKAEEIHFHEVGNMDAVADIAGVCILMEMLSPQKVVVSPVNLGSGHVHCAHGVLPVPAPATAFILSGVPAYSSSISGELCTPTGAALLKYFADEFGNMPCIVTEKTGYGMGKKDFPVLNCVRSFIGQTDECQEEITELICNIDDMTGEALGFAVDTLLDHGACDVFTQSAGMKKNRPGTLLTCLCRISQRDEMISLIFKHTSTIGIRENVCRRYTLRRSVKTVTTSLGNVRVKYSEGYGVKRCKAEYDDISAIAVQNNISFEEVKKTVEKEI